MYKFFGYFVILCILIQASYWIATSFKVKKAVERRGHKSWRLRILALASLVIVYLLFSNGWAGPQIIMHNYVVGVISDVVTFSGLVLAIWSRKALGKNWSADIVFKKDHELIESGPYAFIRHPIYTSLALMVLGAAIYYGYLGGFIFLVIFFFGAWIKGNQEENLLISHFPDEYPKYKSRVKSLIPFIF